MSATDPNSSDAWTWAMMEPKLSEREIALRNVFVDEYLTDRNAVAAATRLGFHEEFAGEWAKKLMAEPYVQRRIKALMLAEPTDPKAEEALNKRRILQGLIDEAFNKGPDSKHAARVAALGKLATLYGMEAPKKIDINQRIRGGVMVVPGAISNVEDWERAALESQQQLTHDVRH